MSEKMTRKELLEAIPSLAEKPGAKVEPVNLTPEKIAEMKALLREGRKTYDEVMGALTGKMRLPGGFYPG